MMMVKSTNRKKKSITLSGVRSRLYSNKIESLSRRLEKSVEERKSPENSDQVTSDGYMAQQTHTTKCF